MLIAVSFGRAVRESKWGHANGFESVTIYESKVTDS